MGTTDDKRGVKWIEGKAGVALVKSRWYYLFKGKITLMVGKEEFKNKVPHSQSDSFHVA